VILLAAGRFQVPYLIDGHNLIGAMPQISLEDPDDEQALISLLQAFCQRSRHMATVYFDRRAPGSQGMAKSGRLSVHFVQPPRTADDAITSHLDRLGGQAQNWTVVSSDHQVQQAARHAGARVMSSRAFGRLLRPGSGSDPERDDAKPAGVEDPDELARWERLFRKGDD
jgi:predicted RNA-binding protein with PIN domain